MILFSFVLLFAAACVGAVILAPKFSMGGAPGWGYIVGGSSILTTLEQSFCSTKVGSII